MLLVALLDPPYGFDESLADKLYTLSRLTGDEQQSPQSRQANVWVSFLSLARTIIKKIDFKLLLVGRRPHSAYLFDIIRAKPTVIYCDGYHEKCLKMAEYLYPDYSESDLLEIFQELYYSTPDTSNMLNNATHIKACWWSFKHARENWFWSERHKNYVSNLFPEMSGSFKSVYPLVDTSLFRPGKGEKEPTILFTTMQPLQTKGFDVLVKAFKMLPGNVKLKLVVERVDLLSRDMLEGLGERVTVMTKVPKRLMPDIYRSCMVNCRVSRDDNTPLSILESMACSLPVVVSPQVANSLPIIEEGVTGFVVDPSSHEELARKLNFLIRDSKRRIWMGKECRKRALRYSIERNIREVFRLIS